MEQEPMVWQQYWNLKNRRFTRLKLRSPSVLEQQEVTLKCFSETLSSGLIIQLAPVLLSSTEVGCSCFMDHCWTYLIYQQNIAGEKQEKQVIVLSYQSMLNCTLEIITPRVSSM